MKKVIPHRDRSPYGWWIGTYLERFEYHDEDRRNPNRRCLAYENTILIQAKNRETAYRKLMTRGSIESAECWDTDTGRRGRWRFEGVVQLLPIYDSLEDGAEILWTAHRNRSVKSIQSLTRTKEQLPVFDPL